MQALALRDAGHQVKQIVELLGVPSRTIQKWFQKNREDPHYVPKSMQEVSALGGESMRRLKTLEAVARRDIERMGDEIAQQEMAEAVSTFDHAVDVGPSQEELDAERLAKVRANCAGGDYLRAASEISDGYPDEWQQLGTIFAPEFLKSWQCGRLFWYLSSGVHRAISLARVGVRLGDFEVWLARASNHQEPYSTFIDLCSMAQASACARLQKSIQKKTPGWQALTWSLERISPEIFARHVMDERAADESSLADVGEDNLKRTALAYIIHDNDRKAAEIEHVDLDEIEGRNE